MLIVAYCLLFLVIGLITLSWLVMAIFGEHLEIEKPLYAELASLSKEYPPVLERLNCTLKRNGKVSVGEHKQMLALAGELAKHELLIRSKE